MHKRMYEIAGKISEMLSLIWILTRMAVNIITMMKIALIIATVEYSKPTRIPKPPIN